MMSQFGEMWMSQKTKMNFEQWLKKNYNTRLCDFYCLDKETKERIRDCEFENYKKEE